MSDLASMTFYGRGLLQLSHLVMQQLPPHLQAEIVPDVFLSAFSFRRNGETVGIGTWEQAPMRRVCSPDGDHHRQTQKDMLHGLYDHMVKGFPSLDSVNPYYDLDVRNVARVLHTAGTTSFYDRPFITHV